MIGDGDDEASQLEQLLDTPDLAAALESDRFKQFLDHLPIGIAVSELGQRERITYANLAFEGLTGRTVAEVEGKPWKEFTGSVTSIDDGRPLAAVIAGQEDYLGTFKIEHDAKAVAVDAWSNVIEDENGAPMFRLVALVDLSQRPQTDRGALELKVQEKDTLLRELQHRVKNNLQMITALIRLEARTLPDDNATTEAFDRLAGRIEALAVLYRALAEEGAAESIDLGIYLSEVASAVMRAHAVEGIRLDLKVDTWPVSINVAMPTGLVVNELLTNALKHAFAGRDGGTITLRSLVDETGCRVMVADDGNGFPAGTAWPQRGKMAALIVQSLRENAKAGIDVQSAPNKGVTVSIFFARDNAAPDPTEE
jgi:two-component sensor histidine kinase